MSHLKRITVEWLCGPPTAVRVTIASLLLETVGFGLPLWFGLWNIKHVATLNRILEGVGLGSGSGFMILLTYLLFRHHLGRLRYLKESPFRETLYRPAMVWIGFWIATLGLIGFCLVGFLAGALWHLLFHWSAIAVLLMWMKECTEDKESCLAHDLKRIRASIRSRSSPEGTALIISAHLLSSIFAGIVAIEAVLFLSWRLFHSVGGTLVMAAFMILLCGGFAGLILGSSVRMARSARLAIKRDSENKGSGL